VPRRDGRDMMPGSEEMKRQSRMCLWYSRYGRYVCMVNNVMGNEEREQLLAQGVVQSKDDEDQGGGVQDKVRVCILFTLCFTT
jgi:hypothetical protein